MGSDSAVREGVIAVDVGLKVKGCKVRGVSHPGHEPNSVGGAAGIGFELKQEQESKFSFA